MSKTKVNPLLISGLLVALISNSCGTPDHPVERTESESFCLNEAFKAQTESELPLEQAVVQAIPLTGIVEPNPDKVLPVVSLVSGIISNTAFSLGDMVTKGQVLAELRSTELSGLQSQSKTINSQVSVAETRLKSVQSMFDDGISSQRGLLEAHSELEVLKAQSERINADLSLFSASPENDVFQIKAPSTGIITGKNITPGMQITGGDHALFTISDLSEVWVLVNIYATNIPNIETGMKVTIKTLPYPDKVFNGKIDAISQVLDTEASVLKARVVLDNSDLQLKPGMTVDVSALKELQTEALAVPTSAMVFDSSQNYVVVYKGDCDLEIRPVDIITQNNAITFVSGGLEKDEPIITKNHLLIYEQIKHFQN
jgi:cobalt-zinc-cadmium efflux system membrane fusion protein